jgi:hypothetical protein
MALPTRHLEADVHTGASLAIKHAKRAAALGGNGRGADRGEWRESKRAERFARAIRKELGDLRRLRGEGRVPDEVLQRCDDALVRMAGECAQLRDEARKRKAHPETPEGQAEGGRQRPSLTERLKARRARRRQRESTRP